VRQTPVMAEPRRGRPPATSRRELELIALRRFTEQGFDETTIDQIAAEAGVSRRTFFRYFNSKASVLWSDFDTEVGTIRSALADARYNLISSVPELHASAAVHYDAWERAISDFVAKRIRQPADSLYPLAVGRATLAACRAGYDRWVARADTDLTVYLDAALRALAAGFAPDALRGQSPRLARNAR